MNAKEHLNQARWLDEHINTKLDDVSRLRSMAQRITASYDHEPVSHTRNVTSMQDAIIRLMEEEEKLNADIDRLVDLKREINSVLRQIDDPDSQMLLELRYLCCRSWEEIAQTMHINIRTAYRLHGSALRRVDEVLHRKNIGESP